MSSWYAPLERLLSRGTFNTSPNYVLRIRIDPTDNEIADKKIITVCRVEVISVQYYPDILIK